MFGYPTRNKVAFPLADQKMHGKASLTEIGHFNLRRGVSAIIMRISTRDLFKLVRSEDSEFFFSAGLVHAVDKSKV